jgi:trimethylamine--corrinoid protein Co-methyltransferase
MNINDAFFLAPRPLFRLLSEEQKRRIHEGSLELLERTGADFHGQEAVDLLESAGCRVIDSKRVKIPSHVVEEAIRTAPKRVVLANRQAKRVMPLWGDNIFYGPGSETPFTLDPYTGERRPAVKSDVVRAARVVDALPNIHFCMSFALASDIAKKCEDVHHFEAMVLNTAKPILFTTWDLDGIKGVYDICCAVAGSGQAFQANPFILHYVEPISPLVNPRESLEKLIFSARQGIPVMYTPAPSAGGTAPVTLAGAFVLSNAENLMGLVISQAAKRGAHFVYGGGPGILDPVTGIFPYGAPENFITRVVRTEMAHYYGFPCFSTGGCTDAKVLDQQAAFEAGMSLLLSSLAGANLMHDVGYIESGYTSSLDLLVMADEMIHAILRVLKGVTVSPEHLAVDLLDSVGPGGNFLANTHTVKHFRDELTVSKLFDRRSYAAWLSEGSKTLKDRCNERLRSLLRDHAPEPLPDSTVQAVKSIVAELDKKRKKGFGL